MALSDVRSYYRSKLDSLNYSEWTDGFNFENIPQSILDRSYHLEIGVITSGASSQTVFTFSYPITVRIFLKGFVDPSGAIDDAILQSETVLASVLDAQARYSENIKSIDPLSISILQLADSNDNDLILEMEFNNKIMNNF